MHEVTFTGRKLFSFFVSPKWELNPQPSGFRRLRSRLNKRPFRNCSRSLRIAMLTMHNGDCFGGQTFCQCKMPRATRFRIRIWVRIRYSYRVTSGLDHHLGYSNPLICLRLLSVLSASVCVPSLSRSGLIMCGKNSSGWKELQNVPFDGNCRPKFSKVLRHLLIMTFLLANIVYACCYNTDIEK